MAERPLFLFLAVLSIDPLPAKCSTIVPGSVFAIRPLIQSRRVSTVINSRPIFESFIESPRRIHAAEASMPRSRADFRPVGRCGPAIWGDIYER